MPSPIVTVLMPCYNGERFLGEAIQSILDQTLSDFELLLVDDGSTDGSLDIAKAFSDPRIRILKNPSNLGLAATLNNGLHAAKGRYIARLDCDDLSSRNRLERQVEFLDKNPHVGLVGSWVTTMTPERKCLVSCPENDRDIRIRLVFGNSFSHSAVTFPKALIERYNLYYDTRFRFAQDYELWVRFAQCTSLANLPEVLGSYRVHGSNASVRYRLEQRAMSDRVRCLYLESMGIDATPEERELHIDLVHLRFRGDLDRLRAAERWLIKLANTMVRVLEADESAILQMLGLYWYSACGRASGKRADILRVFIHSPVGRAAHAELKIKLLYRAVFRRPIPEPSETHDDYRYIN